MILKYLAIAVPLLLLAGCWKTAHSPTQDSVTSMLDIPGEQRSRDEVEIHEMELIEFWESKLTKQLEEMKNQEGWSYTIKTLELSKSNIFPVILRAKVEWQIDGETVESARIMWEDSLGRTGGGGFIR